MCIAIAENSVGPFNC